MSYYCKLIFQLYSGEREKKVSRIKLFNIYIGNVEISFYCIMIYLLFEFFKGF